MRKTKIIQITILILSLVFISLGTVNGEAHLVLMKAINICLECIGIG